MGCKSYLFDILATHQFDVFLNKELTSEKKTGGGANTLDMSGTSEGT